MNKTIVVFLLLLTSMVFAQGRLPFHGKAIADVMKAEDLTVKNITGGTDVVTNAAGNFDIAAREGDVLEFSSVVFKTFTHTLTAKDLKEELFVIRVAPLSVLLDEIEVSGLTGSLEIDSKYIEVVLLNERFKDDFDSALLNLGRIVDNPGGNMNFMAIFGMLGDAISPSKPNANRLGQRRNMPSKSVEYKTFSKVLRENYPDSFFIDTIKVPKDKIVLFLHFCNDGAKRYLLDPKNETQLITYLKERLIRFTYQSQNNEN